MHEAKNGYHFCHEIRSGKENVHNDLVDLLVCCDNKVLLICFSDHMHSIVNGCVHCVWVSWLHVDQRHVPDSRFPGKLHPSFPADPSVEPIVFWCLWVLEHTQEEVEVQLSCSVEGDIGSFFKLLGRLILQTGLDWHVGILGARISHYCLDQFNWFLHLFFAEPG